MTPLNYSTFCENRLNDFFDSFVFSSDSESFFPFLNCQRNLKNYLNICDESEVDSFFRKLQGLIFLSSEDQLKGDGLNVAEVINKTLDSAPFVRKPAIYCTYHIGAFRLVPYLLAQYKIDFVLVVDEKTYNNQLVDFNAAYDRLGSEDIVSFSVLNAEDPTIGLKLIRTIREGKSVLFYVDGNSGVGGMGRNDNKLTQVKFLGKDIWARKGIAFLSYATGAPIFPIVSIRADNYIPSFFIEDPLIVDRAGNREKVLNSVSQKLFSILENYLRKYPEQWEGWLYLHLFEVDRTLSTLRVSYSYKESSLLVFNSDKFDFFKRLGKWHLFDKINAFVWPISDDLYRLLSFLKTSAAPFSAIKKITPDALFEDLFSVGVFNVQEDGSLVVEH